MDRRIQLDETGAFAPRLLDSDHGPTRASQTTKRPEVGWQLRPGADNVGKLIVKD
jgi:hypothetical protein